MSDYKKMLGYSNKKKSVKKESKPKKNKLIENIKNELNEWDSFKKTPKRWSKNFGGSGLTEYEKNKINEGPAYEYAKSVKNIEKQLKQFSADNLDFYELLREKGQDKEASNFLKMYKRYIVGFTKDFKKFVRKLL
jgi:hypothetical protein